MQQLGEPESNLDGHVLCLPKNDWEQKSVMADWVRRGFRTKQLVVIIDPFLFDPDRSARSALLQHSINVDVAVEHGRIVILEPSDFWPPDGATALLQNALAAGMTGMRITAQLPEVVARLDDVTALEVEQVVASFCGSTGVSALCQYGHAAPVQGNHAQLTQLMDLHARTLTAAPA